MNNSADIRKDNKKTIYHFMLDGKPYTKQQVSAGTGLSAATCNTLLNDMTAQGMISGVNKQSGEVGRSSVLYQINEDHEFYLAVHFYMEQKFRWVEHIVFSATGRILSKEKKKYDVLEYSQLESIIVSVVEKYPTLAQIIIGVIIAFAILSFTLPAGLKYSSFASK